MGFVWDYYPAGGSEKLVALALADEADHEGNNIYPGVGRIARRCNMSARGVQKILRRIEGREIGGVRWFELLGEGKGGRRQTRRYRCAIDDLRRAVYAKETVNDGHPLESPETTNTVHGLEDETTNDVQGLNHEQNSPFAGKGRTNGSKRVNASSPDPLYPYRTAPAQAHAHPSAEAHARETHVPTQISEWGNHLMHRHGYARGEVMSVASMGMFRDWVQRALPIWLVDDAIAAAHAKNGGRPGQPAYYRNFVNQMVAEHEAATDARASGARAQQERESHGANSARHHGESSSRSIRAWADAARDF